MFELTGKSLIYAIDQQAHNISAKSALTGHEWMQQPGHIWKMIYAMPGMQTELNAVINQPGVYEGMSANYSGAGFSGMTFKFHGLARADFDAWVEKNRAAGTALDRSAYLTLERPSHKEPVRRYASVAPDLYDAILNRCVAPGTSCMRDIMHQDAQGGGGLKGVVENRGECGGNGAPMDHKDHSAPADEKKGHERNQ